MSKNYLPAQWSIGDTILDLYEIAGILGEGGMGRVYKVFHKRWKIDLAVKSPKPDILEQESGKDNFIREAETWVNLGLHPHTVSCYYVRTIDETPRIFIECVEGGSLADWIHKRKLYEEGTEKGLERILDIAIQFAWGLHYAHQQGLVHQDVKPANVLMTPGGVAKVTDFGLAQARANSGEISQASSPGESMIVAGAGLMTPAYCSPEQASGRSLTRKTDIWSWGLSILEMFAGEMFWAAGTPVGVAVGQLAPQALTSYLEDYMQDQSCIDMPAPVADLLVRCFAADPPERPRDMQEIADALIEIYGQATGSPYNRRTPQPGKGIADSLNNRAMSLIDLGKQTKAEELWEEALRIQPLHPESLFNRGLVLWRSGRITDLDLWTDLYEAYRTNERDWAKYERYLSELHLERGDYASVIELTEAVLRANPGLDGAQHAIDLCKKRLPETRHFLRVFERCAESINAICLTHDLRYIIVGGTKDGGIRAELDRALGAGPAQTSKGTLRLLDFETGELVHNFAGYEESVSTVRVTDDGCYLFTGAKDALRVFDVETGRCIVDFKGKIYSDESVAHTPDRRYELRGGGYERVDLWVMEPEQGWYCAFNGYTGDVGSVCLGSDGQLGLRVVRHDENNLLTFMLYDVATGGDLRPFTGVFKGKVGEIVSIDISNDQRYVSAGGGYGSIRLWDIQSGSCRAVTDDYIGWVTCVCFTPDARFVLSGGAGLKLWDTETGQLVREFEGHTGQVNSICITADGRFALSASGNISAHDDTVRLWDIETGHCLRIFDGHKSWVKSICLSPDGRHLLSAAIDQTVRLWDIATGRCLRSFREHGTGENLVCVSQDGRFAVSAGTDAVRVWSIEEMKPEIASMMLSQVQTSDEFFEYEIIFMQELDLARQAMELGEYATAANHLRTARSQPGYDKHVDAINLWFELYPHLPHVSVRGWWDENPFGGNKEIAIACITADGKHVLSGSRQGWDEALGEFGHFIKLWDIKTGRCEQAFYGHKEKIESISASQDGRLVLTASSAKDDALKLWDIASASLVSDFSGHKESVRTACLSPDGRFVVCTTGGEFVMDAFQEVKLKILDTATGECLHTLAGHSDDPISISISSDSGYVLSGGRDQELKLWDINSGQCLRDYKGHTSPVLTVGLTSDGKYAISGSTDTTIKIWDVQSGHCMRTFEAHTDIVNSVCLSPDGRFALSGSRDQTVRLWDVMSGQCLQTFSFSTNEVLAVSFSPDARFALVAGKSIFTMGYEATRLLFIDWELGDKPSSSIVSTSF